MTVEANSSPPIHHRNDGIGLEAFAIGETYETAAPNRKQSHLYSYSADVLPACRGGVSPAHLGSEAKLKRLRLCRRRRNYTSRPGSLDLGPLQPWGQRLHEAKRHQIR